MASLLLLSALALGVSSADNLYFAADGPSAMPLDVRDGPRACTHKHASVEPSRGMSALPPIADVRGARSKSPLSANSGHGDNSA